jgi:hypothetical protein
MAPMSDFRSQVRMPPRRLKADGSERRVGVELEFGALSAASGALLVQRLFGGSIEEEDPHRFHIRGTRFGTFTSELDSQYAHRSAEEALQPAAGSDMLGGVLQTFRHGMRQLYGDISSILVPCEIVSPPVLLSDLPTLDSLVAALAAAGAEGTRSRPFYAFGAQLNPDVATTDAAWLTAMLKAYLLVSDWLRAVIGLYMTRQLVSFADPFPDTYVRLVVDPGYWPSLPALISDYLAANPTRNRELDMLPLFAWLDGAAVRARVPDKRVKARPTFHYRLPDANIGVPNWGVTLEWNRWCVVERLAEQRTLLDAMGTSFIDNSERLVPESWALKTSEWLLLSQD